MIRHFPRLTKVLVALGVLGVVGALGYLGIGYADVQTKYDRALALADSNAAAAQENGQGMAALQQQVEQLGEEPVVTAPPEAPEPVPAAPPDTGLSPDEAAEVRMIAAMQARSLGLDDTEQTALIARTVQDEVEKIPAPADGRDAPPPSPETIRDVTFDTMAALYQQNPPTDGDDGRSVTGLSFDDDRCYATFTYSDATAEAVGPLCGRDGTNGASAYDLWLEQGNEGSAADFLASLKGDPGDDSDVPGPEGPAGPAGRGVTALACTGQGPLTRLRIDVTYSDGATDTITCTEE